MSLTVVGSIAFDAVETPAGKRDRLLGGAAVHFALASSFLAETRVVGPVGDDFGDAEYEVLRSRGVVTDDIEHVPGGKTFFWSGRYQRDVNIRDTLQTDLNVFEHFEPKLSEASRAAETLFLANIQPDLQRAVREQCDAGPLQRARLDEPVDRHRARLARAHDPPGRLRGPQRRRARGSSPTSPTSSAPRARCSSWGRASWSPSRASTAPRCSPREGFFGLPAYPVEDVVDPTGAGDSFAGGFMGFIAAHADEELSDELLRRAMAYGTALASFNVEAFGTERMQTLTAAEVTDRVAELQRITRFEDVPIALRA